MFFPLVVGLVVFLVGTVVLLLTIFLCSAQYETEQDAVSGPGRLGTRSSCDSGMYVQYGSSKIMFVKLQAKSLD